METVLTNAVGAVRRVTLHGREFVVAPMTLIVPGVLPGSAGPLYYPDEELAADPTIWNGMPIVVGHPVDDKGNPVSARSPEVLEDKQLGTVYHTTFGDTLTAEGWFDEALTARYDEQLPEAEKVLPRLLAQQPIELSTGLFTRNEPLEEEAVDPRTGKTFKAIARDYKADHLAILPAERGACSVYDGCGVGVVANADGTDPGTDPETTPTKETPVNRAQVIKWLTTNCSCWKDKDDAALLEKMSDAKLKGLRQNAIASKVANAAKKGFKHVYRAVTNAEGDAEGEVAGIDLAALAEFLGVTTDAAADPVGFIAELKGKIDEIASKLGSPAPAAEPDGDEVVADPAAEPAVVASGTDDDDDPKPTGNRRRGAGTQTAKQYLAQMPAELKGVWNSMVRGRQKEKAALIARLTQHLTGNKRAQAIAFYKDKEPEELQVVLDSMPKPTANKRANPDPVDLLAGDGDGDLDMSLFPSLDGAQGGPVGNAGGDEDDDLLELPRMDYGPSLADRYATRN